MLLNIIDYNPRSKKSTDTEEGTNEPNKIGFDRPTVSVTSKNANKQAVQKQKRKLPAAPVEATAVVARRNSSKRSRLEDDGGGSSRAKITQVKDADSSSTLPPRRKATIKQKQHEQQREEATVGEDQQPKNRKVATNRRGHLTRRQAAQPAAVDAEGPDWASVQHCLLDEVADVAKLFQEQLDMDTPTADSEKVFSKFAIRDCKDIHPYLVSLLTEKLGLEYFTKVQAETLPLVLAGRDVLIKTQTGSGKSLALLLPLVQQLQSVQPPLTRSSGVQALVLCPTRELADQSHQLLERLLRPFVRIVSGQLVGGVKRKAQKAALRKGLNVLVATPHRLLDHLRSSSRLDLAAGLRLLVIDEADRLAELGYERDVRQIVEAACAGGRRPQTLLCSATLGPGVENLAGLALAEPAAVTEEAALPASVRHHVVATPTRARLRALLAALRALVAAGQKAAVFLPTQASVDFHHALLSSLLSDTVPLCRLHGSVAHAERIRAYREFAGRAGCGLLVTSDVSARGLDLSRLSWVVQGPGEPQLYCHRAGRTARLGRPGRSLLMLDAGEAAGFLRLLCESPASPDGIRFAPVPARHLIERYCPENFAQLVGMVSEEPSLRALAEDAYVSSVRARASFAGELKAVLPMPHLGHLASSFCLADAPGVIARRARERRHAGSAAAPRGDGEEQPPGGRAANDGGRRPAARATSRVSAGQRVRRGGTGAGGDRMSEFASGI